MKYPILICAAHPDDIEFGLGAAVAKWTREGRGGVRAVVMTCGGYVDGYGNVVRTDEEANSNSYSSLTALGVFSHPLGFKTQYLTGGRDEIAGVEAVIKEASAQTVIIPWAGEHHQDHRALHHAALAASRRVQNVYGYNGNIVLSVNPTQFSPNLFISVTEEDVDRKIETCRMHTVEWQKYDREKGGKLAEYLKARCMTYGGMIGVDYAEGLVQYRAVR